MMAGHRRPYDPVKRAIDAIAAAVLLVVTMPLQLAVALLIWMRLGHPVLFRQERVGLGGEVFQLVKFRTMRSTDAALGLVEDAQRLTPLGRVLRATSLDELPSLANVLRGEMSMVGPRPLLVRYLPRYNTTQARRHEVRPGMTGLAQVSGRNSASWEDRFTADVVYVDHRSFWLDARIVARTIAVVLRRDGISAEGHATSPEFLGSEEATR